MISEIPKFTMCLQDTMFELKDEIWRYNIHNEWAAIVKEYSQRAVTFPGDRFPALMGIVTE